MRNQYDYSFRSSRIRQSYKDEKKKKKNRIRILIILLIVCFVMPIRNEIKENWFLFLMRETVPGLVYGQQNGSGNVEYAASYGIPDWFFSFEQEERKEETVTTETTEAVAMLPKSGITYTREQLSKTDFLLNKIFVVDSNTSMIEEELDIHNLLDKDLSIDGWNQEQEYKILIYHTHASEDFIDSRAGKQEDTIVGIGSYLKELLEKQYHIPVYHDTTTYDVVDGVLDRSRAYEQAYTGVSEILKKYPSIEVVIDLHRDGVAEETKLVTEINGKPTAKIMFLNGVSRSNLNGDIDYLANPNKLTNLALSFQLFLSGREHYGDYVRKIYVRSLRYNLHILPRTTLIEVGAQNNTVEEERNAMEPLAAILYDVLKKESDNPKDGQMPTVTTP